MSKIDYGKKVIQVQNLKQYFSSGMGKKKIVVRAVDGISFDIYKREVFGLVGESGCGKTTTGRTIIKLYNPTDGKIIFNDRVVGAGYRTQIENIKKAKRETKSEIVKLIPLKNALNEVKQKHLLEKALHKEVLSNLKKEYFKDKTEINRVIIDYKNNLRTIKEEYIIEIKEIKRQRQSDIQRINIKGIIPIIDRYYLEKKHAIKRAKEKTAYIKSSVMEQVDKDDQIKDIEKTKNSELVFIEENTAVRLKKLISDFDKYVSSYGDVSYNKIVRDFKTQEKQKKRLKLKEIKTKFKDDLAKRKEDYNLKLEKAREKNFDEEKIKENLLALKTKYQENVLKQKAIFKDANDTYKLKTLEIKEEYKYSKISESDQEKVDKLKEDLRIYISEQKAEIKELKRLNKLKESPEEREIRLNKIAVQKEKFNSNKVELANKFNLDDESQNREYKKQLKELTNEHNKNIATIQKTKPTRSNLMTPMQMIFQDPISSLNPRMVVSEIISEGLKISGVKDKNIIKEKTYEILNLVGLNREHATRYPHEFSGGQRQRIGVARALITNPDFIIADEPISALDVSIQAQVINLLNDLKEELDLTILFIAHDLSVVKYFCDRIAVMYYGKIVELASSDELFLNPLHPYTKSLLSAIPQPDPHSERDRKRVLYNPLMHDYFVDKPSLKEIKKGHFILANDKEFEEYKKVLK